jgi:uncharacterized protein (TIGR02117 family)
MLHKHVVLAARVAIAVAASLAAGCAASTGYRQPTDVSPTYSIYVVRRALHTGIAVPPAGWPDQAWPVLTDFPGARYLEFGWGDAAYYQAETKTLSMTLAAVFWPTPSVVEVLGTADVSMQASSNYEAVEIRVTGQQLDALAASIAASFSGDSVTRTGTVGAYPEGQSRFYVARGKFHLLRMCNWWSAKRLEAAGCSIGHWPVLTASRVLREARRCQAARMP